MHPLVRIILLYLQVGLMHGFPIKFSFLRRHDVIQLANPNNYFYVETSIGVVDKGLGRLGSNCYLTPLNSKLDDSSHLEVCIYYLCVACMILSKACSTQGNQSVYLRCGVKLLRTPSNISTFKYLHHLRDSQKAQVQRTGQSYRNPSHFVHYREVVLFLEVQKCIIAMGNDNLGTL